MLLHSPFIRHPHESDTLAGIILTKCLHPGDLNNHFFAIVFKDCDEKQREGIANLLSDSLRAKKSA
jgi:hypothetical protein